MCLINGLFVIALEILSLKIQNDTSKIGNFEVKQSFFADDSIFILDRDENSVKIRLKLWMPLGKFQAFL